MMVQVEEDESFDVDTPARRVPRTAADRETYHDSAPRCFGEGPSGLSRASAHRLIRQTLQPAMTARQGVRSVP